MTRRFASSAIDRSLAVAVAAIACLGCATAVPAAASADVGAKIIYRCGHGESLAGFTVAQYQHALKELTADTEALEYSSCAEEIQKAMNAAAGHKSAGGGGGPGAGATRSAGSGSALAPVQPTPAQLRTLNRTRASTPAPVELEDGHGSVVPGVVHANISSATSSLPTPALVVIALVLVGLALLAGREAKERLHRSRLR